VHNSQITNIRLALTYRNFVYSYPANYYSGKLSTLYSEGNRFETRPICRIFCSRINMICGNSATITSITSFRGRLGEFWGSEIFDSRFQGHHNLNKIFLPYYSHTKIRTIHLMILVFSHLMSSHVAILVFMINFKIFKTGAPPLT
jgi:hypothetical protein